MLRHLGCVCVFQALSSGSVEMRSGVVVTIEIRWVQAVVLPWRHCSIASQLLPSCSKEQHEVAVLGWRGLWSEGSYQALLAAINPNSLPCGDMNQRPKCPGDRQRVSEVDGPGRCWVQRPPFTDQAQCRWTSQSWLPRGLRSRSGISSSGLSPYTTNKGGGALCRK